MFSATHCRVSFTRLPALVVAVFMSVVGSNVSTAADCLYSNAQGKNPPGKCEPGDPIHLGDQDTVRRMIATFGASQSQIKFVQCTGGPFSTSAFADRSGTLIFTITYPAGLDGSEYLAPITHELGHVFQLERAGSLANLRAQLKESSERIELGADLLAGVAFRRNLHPAERALFQQNLMLTGNFAPNDHGTPGERTSAFRMGYFSRVGERDLAEAAQEFQDNGFANIQGTNP